MKLYKICLLIVTLLLAAPVANASISFLILAGRLGEGDGTSISQMSGEWRLLADLDRDGFGNILAGSIGVADFVGTGDLIVAGGSFDTLGDGFLLENPTQLTLEMGWDEGDPLALLWFEEVLPQEMVSEGMGYGLYSDPLGIDGSDPWVTPTDGTINHNLFLITPDASIFGGGSVMQPASLASFSVGIPEPHITSLLFLAASLIVLRRQPVMRLMRKSPTKHCKT